MDGLSAAGGVISVVGLAGQVLQGCSYLRNIYDDAKDSPCELRLLRMELTIISGIVESMRNDPQTSSIQNGHHPAEGALLFCDETLTKLRRIVEKYGVVTGTSKRRRWGKGLAMAMSADKIKKHVERLDRAKDHLLAIQSTTEL